MAIHVTKADEAIEVKTICLTIYSNPGLGKTSLAFTAANPLLLDFDKGSYRAVSRKDVVQAAEWKDVAGIKAEDVAGYDTIVIDTVGKALDALTADVVKAKPAYAYGGALSQQGWGQLAVRFRGFLKLLQGFGKDVILISHMDEKSDGDTVKERLKISGGSKDLVLTDSDAIGRISIANKQRLLVFSPTESSFGKDPVGLDTITIPDASDPAFADFLANVIGLIKDGLNALSEEQIVHKSEFEWFQTVLPDITTPEQINEILGRAKKAGKDVSRMVVEHAANLGFDFDQMTKKYTWGEPNPDDEEQPMIGKPEETDEKSAA